MANESISRFFERLGFKLRNKRNSWGAINGKAVMLRSWDDQMESSPRRVRVLASEWRAGGVERVGFIERRAQLQAIWQGGVAAYTITVTPKIAKKDGSRHVGSFGTDTVYPITSLTDEGDYIYAVLGEALAVPGLAEHIRTHRTAPNTSPLPVMLDAAIALEPRDVTVPGAEFEQPQRRDWTDKELHASVQYYQEMMRLETAGAPYVKAFYYRLLAERFGRVAGAFERRMQNISYLLDARGLNRLRGLKPQQNIGANVEPRLLVFLADLFDDLTPSIEIAEEVLDAANVVEGAKRQIVVNAYERDPTAKPRCIKKWGATCVVCAFNFHAAYGDLGKGFIHVHHLRPIHTIGDSYELDPENDLRPVCPNCHSMLHRTKDVLSIEDLVGRLLWKFDSGLSSR